MSFTALADEDDEDKGDDDDDDDDEQEMEEEEDDESAPLTHCAGRWPGLVCSGPTPKHHLHSSQIWLFRIFLFSLACSSSLSSALSSALTSSSTF